MNNSSYFADLIDQHRKCKSLPVDFDKIELAVVHDNTIVLVLSSKILHKVASLKQLIQSEFDISNASNTRTIINGLTDILQDCERQNAILEAKNYS